MTLVNLCHFCSMVLHFKLLCKKIAYFFIGYEHVTQERRYLRAKNIIDINIEDL